MVRFEKLSRKAYRARFGSSSRANTTLSEGSEPIIYVPGKSSSHTKLHEYYHAKYGSKEDLDKRVDLDEGLLEELAAENYAYSIRGKSGPLQAILVEATEAIDYGYSPTQVMKSLNTNLEKLGYRISPELKTVFKTRLIEYKRSK